MYSTCLFCNSSLGANELVESFPVGRRLAFDQALGRLWVVCRRCDKWNLTPLEERWEAIEACERLFRDSRKRVTTENIGLAKLSEGLELIRIGRPLRPEFAAWRYGNRFERRYRRNVASMIAGGVITGALTTAGVAGFFGGMAAMMTWIVGTSGRDIVQGRRVIARIPDTSGRLHKVRGVDAMRSSLVPGEQREDWGLRLHLGFNEREVVVTGDGARRIAGRLVPLINRFGGTRNQVSQALRDLDECGGPDRYLSWAARRSMPGGSLWASAHWLGVEMALNEENERYALESELAHLEDAWKDAEELAAIADRLTLPKVVEQQFARLRGMHRNDTEA
jgi:hypothetical protein